jgi:tripartite-type tricarboxylate transporter receptor subunit TctC
LNRPGTEEIIVNTLFIGAAAALVAGLFGAPAVVAQTFPSKAVRLVIPFPPGGSSDVIGRMLAERLGEEWKQPVVVENRPGAGTTIASAFVAGSPPDGYTLYVQGVSTHASTAALYKNLSFDPAKAFTAVANVSMSPFILVAHPSVKANSARELLQLAKAATAPLRYGSSGNGGSPHLLGEMFAATGGVKLVHVPYKGVAPSTQALVAGEIEFALGDVSVMPQVRAGKIRALAVSMPKQTALVPGVPTFAESGVPGLVMPSYIAILGPAGMPREITTAINAQINRAIANDAFKQKLFGLGFEPSGGTSEELANLLTFETQRLTQIIEKTGIRLE